MRRQFVFLSKSPDRELARPGWRPGYLERGIAEPATSMVAESEPAHSLARQSAELSQARSQSCSCRGSMAADATRCTTEDAQRRRNIPDRAARHAHLPDFLSVTDEHDRRLRGRRSIHRIHETNAPPLCHRAAVDERRILAVVTPARSGRLVHQVVGRRDRGSTQSECLSPYVCRLGFCRAECNVDRDCPQGACIVEHHGGRADGYATIRDT
jgi:hypothetical protein